LLPRGEARVAGKEEHEMAKITFFRDGDAPFVNAQDSGGSRVRHPGADDDPQLLEVRVNPNVEVETHAHKQPEVMYVVSGEMRFGAQLLRPGDSVSIAGLTVYTFTAGPNGVTFINFRPRQDNTFYTPEQLAEYKQLDPEAQAAMERRLAEAFMARINWADASGQPVGVD
jgi:hypothetical protein